MKEGDRRAIGTMDLLCIVGFALFITWAFLLAFRPTEMYFDENTFRTLLLTQVPMLLAIPLGTAIVMWKADSFETSFLKSRTTVLFSAAASLFPCYLTLASIYPSVNQTLATVVFSFASGIAMVYFWVAWEDLGGRLKTRFFIRFGGSSLIVGAVLFLLVDFLVLPSYRGVMSMVLIIVSSLLLTYVGKKTEARKNIDFKTMKTRIHLDKRVSVLCCFFGIAFGIAWPFVLYLGTVSVCLAILFGVASIAAVMIVFKNNRSVKDDYVISLLRLCIALITAAFIMLSVLPSSMVQHVSLYVVVALWFVFWLIMDGILLQHAVDFELFIPYHTGSCKVSSTFGFAIGWLCYALFIVSSGGKAESVLATSGLVLVAVVVLVGMLLLPLRRRSSEDMASFTAEGCPQEELAIVDDDYRLLVNSGMVEMNQNRITENAYNEITKRFGLSPKEHEILLYLAKGRNAKYIANQLTVSEHTTRTHIYHIYKKMDVHSQQALIDLVDEFRHRELSD